MPECFELLGLVPPQTRDDSQKDRCSGCCREHVSLNYKQEKASPPTRTLSGMWARLMQIRDLNDGKEIESYILKPRKF